ncbi:MAG: hypothetical protein AMXMBFR84_28550 [Candidatus Hydrogenedentota bacterium]
MSADQTSGMTRRNFAKASAAATFAILSSKGAKAQQNSETLKIGLLGCGGRGSGAAQQILQGNENVQLVALADLFEDKAQQGRKRFTEHSDSRVSSKVAIDDGHMFTGLDAYKKILESDIDIIIEATLPYSRPKHIEAAVEAKKHIFTEKPAASDPAGIRQFMAAGRKHKEMGLTFVAGTQRRHHSGYIEGIKKIHDGSIGDVQFLRAHWCGGLPFVHPRDPKWSDLEYRIRNWYGYNWVCGDNIVEQHVHNLDVCNWIMNGHPEAVFASGGRAWKPRTEPYGDLYDNFSCEYEYAGGVFMLSMSRHWDGCDGGVFEAAVGTKGKWNSKLPEDCPPPAVDPYVQEHIDLVNSIRGTGPKWHQAEEVAESTLTAIMGRISAYTGKRLTWDEAMNMEGSIVPAEWSFDLEYPVGPIPVPVKPEIVNKLQA